MRRLRLGVLAALAFASLLAAQNAGDAGAKPKELTALEAEFKADTTRYRDAIKALTATPEYKKAAEAKDQEALKKMRDGLKAPSADAFADRAWELAAKLKGDDRARCLIWTTTVYPAEAKLDRALDALYAEYVKSPIMMELCDQSGFQYLAARGEATKAAARLSSLAANGATPMIKAWALYADSYRLGRGKKATDEEKAKAAELLAQAEKLAAGTDLADQIAAPRFEKEHLQVGMAAPEIVAQNVDGKSMKLSDFRGKVVVLDFWGDW